MPGIQYNNPNTTPSTISTTGTVNGVVQVGQFNTAYYEKQALIEVAKLQFFSQLADVTAMPKNFGKKIKRYQYIPLLDDANLNDQGIDAAGLTLVAGKWQAFNAAGVEVKTGTGWTAPAGGNAGYFDTQANALLAAGTNGGAIAMGGNLYGSSKDVGLINGKMPMLTENGGRVNRVGFKRKELEGTFEKFGFFDEYTQESLDFDTDADLEMHIHREMLNGANEMTEDALQIDLLTVSGATTRYAGVATTKATVNGTAITYGDLMRLSIALDNNRTPKQITAITGSRMVDTKTVAGARAMYIGSELIPLVRAMTDTFGAQAFVPIEKYWSAGSTMPGEIGALGEFRLIVVPEMMKWSGAGADATSNTTHYKTNNRFDVFPMLVVGEGSFTTISFKTDGKSVKFSITHKPPGKETADRNDPFGETGFMSIKWYYGFMALRPERIGLVLTSALI